MTVSRIDEQGRIHLQDSRTLPEKQQLTTTEKLSNPTRSQGETCRCRCYLLADGMRKSCSTVAASRGRERAFTVVTSDRELLRESVARSVVRQSASELSRKAQEPSLERLKPSLREYQRRELPISREQGCENVPEGRGPLRKIPTPETVQAVDREKPSHEQKQEHIIEPGHYFGISR